MAFFDDLTKMAKDVATVAADKTKDAAEQVKLSVAIAGEQKEIDKNYRTIGEWFVNEYEGEIPDAVRELVDAVTASKAKIDYNNERISDIKAAGKLTVATSPDWPPYEYIDDDGNIVGTDILMCQWMAEQLGVELEVQPMAFDACLAAVGQGDVDMMVAGLTYDEARLNRMELTGIYWNEGDQGLLVKKGTGASYNSAESFAGKNVAAQNGTNQQIMVEEQLPDANLELVTKIPDGVNMVKNGRVDALAGRDARLLQSRLRRTRRGASRARVFAQNLLVTQALGYTAGPPFRLERRPCLL